MGTTTTTNLKKNISLFIFLFVNFVFAYKYSYRYTDYALAVSVIVVAFQLLLWKFRKVLIKLGSKLSLTDVLLFAILFIASIFIFKKVPVATLMVDRWSVITSFWDNYFNGEYVYFAESHMGNPPGPMPFYYIIALPFYLIGELGFLSLAGLAVFYALIRSCNIQRHYSTLALILVCSSLFYLWEIVSRSNIMLNATLVLASMVYFNKQNTNKTNQTHLILTGIFTGLCMSTRNVFAIPYIILFLYAFKRKNISFAQLTGVGIIALFVIALTFIPFVYNHVDDFKTMNPFVIQGSSLMPFSYTLIFIALAFVFPFLCREKNDVYFYSSVVLFLTIVFYFGYHIANSGFNAAVHQSRADNSYLILCTPFALFYLLKTDSTEN